MHFTWRRDREWFTVPTTKRMALACCDCGLVHRIVARVTRRGRVFMAAERDEVETANLRRRFRRKFQFKKAGRAR